MAAACALIPAAGRGVRFGGDRNKVLAPLLGRPLLGWTLEAFANCPEVLHIVLIGAEGELETLWELGEFYGGEKFTAAVLGGATRQESVRLGLEMVPVECDTVVVHDAARCCVTPELISSAIRGTEPIAGNATLAIPVTDSLRRLGDGGLWFDTHPDGGIAIAGERVEREGLWRIQTPQAFRSPAGLRKAHARAVERGIEATDDFSLVGGGYIKLGSAENIKVTTPEDLKLAEAILLSRFPSPPSPLSQASLLGEGERGTSGGEVPPPSRSGEAREGVAKRGEGNEIRIGQGYDVHQLAEGRECWLGGVHFPEAKLGPVGHSDADVLLHAICDALLGAAGLGDIGKLFPPSDMAHKDRRSIEFLEEIKTRLDAEGWQISNIDATILAEAPKILPRAAEIKQTVAGALEISPEQVSVKATTNEGLGFIGRGEGIAAHATALLRR